MTIYAIVTAAVSFATYLGASDLRFELSHPIEQDDEIAAQA